MSRDVEIRDLRRRRPRSRFVQASAVVALVLLVLPWIGGSFSIGELASDRRLANLARFLGEIVPYPLRDQGFELRPAVDWVVELMAEKGWRGALATLGISIVAIDLAALLGALASLPAARSWARAEPFAPGPRPAGRLRRTGWSAAVLLTRTLLIFLRSIPEYVWAFLFLAMLGPTAWPAILALAIHNAGILGKLEADLIENLDRGPPAAMRILGAGRLQMAFGAVFPLTLSRFLLLFFYRWESCVREATVIGLLGIVSLGFFVQDARARNLYDELLFLVLVGAALVLIGDLLSALIREFVRRAR